MDTHSPLRLLILGAHPDDAEFHAGGLASLYRQSGHTVKMVSVTNGRAGHHVRPNDELPGLRRAEAAAAAQVIGATYEVWDHPDGELQPTLEVRHQVVPEDDEDRRRWLRQFYTGQIRSRAERCRKELIAAYGAECGSRIEYAEMYEISEYGSPLDDAARGRLFPFVPALKRG